VTRFITDNLKQTLEVDVPFSHVRIRQYPGIISSAEQAKAAAEAAGAVVVVWGNYNQNFVELQVQLGTIQNFTRNKFARDVLERTINVRVQMTDERQQSVAQPVLSVLTVLQTADGNMYDMMQTAATYQEIKVKAAEIIGDSVAAHVHRHVRGFFNDIPSGIQEMNAALALDGGNALLYLYRALLYSRTSDFASATRDAQTAVRLGPAEWAAPYYALAGDEIYSKELISYSTIIKLRPDDWFPLSLRGWVWDLRGDYKQAQTDFERAVALQPNANMPYMLGAMTALHQGRINDAVSLLDTGLKKFPDPTASSRAIRAAMGENVGGIFAQYISLPGYLALGQYEDVKRIAQDTSSNLANAGALMALTGFGPDNDSKVMQSTLNNSLADVYLYTGLAQCNLRLYPPAEAAYTSGIKANPNFTLLYLLRAEIRMKVSKSLAQEDLDAIQKSPQAEAFAPYRAALEAGKLTCENVLTTQNPVLAGRGS
jgi:tetratricopeptide (TPR) repeat protein